MPKVTAGFDRYIIFLKNRINHLEQRLAIQDSSSIVNLSSDQNITSSTNLGINPPAALMATTVRPQEDANVQGCNMNTTGSDANACFDDVNISQHFALHTSRSIELSSAHQENMSQNTEHKVYSVDRGDPAPNIPMSSTSLEIMKPSKESEDTERIFLGNPAVEQDTSVGDSDEDLESSGGADGMGTVSATTLRTSQEETHCISRSYFGPSSTLNFMKDIQEALDPVGKWVVPTTETKDITFRDRGKLSRLCSVPSCG